MGGNEQLGRYLIAVGLLLAGVGLALSLGARIPWWLRPGHMPGDINVQRPGFAMFIPITTMIVLSAILSLVMWLARIAQK